MKRAAATKNATSNWFSVPILCLPAYNLIVRPIFNKVNIIIIYDNYIRILNIYLNSVKIASLCLRIISVWFTGWVGGMMTEKQIETQILTWLNYQKETFAFKVNTVGVFDPVRKVYRKNMNPFVMRGTSDIMGVYKGRFLAIEVKTPLSYKRYMTRPTAADSLQKIFIDKVNRSGGVSLVAQSLDQVIEWFKKQ